MSNTTPDFISTHTFPGNNTEIQTIKKDDGSIWFIAQDLCQALRMNLEKALNRIEHKDRSQIGLRVMLDSFEEEHLLLDIISEQAAVDLIRNSRKADAKKLLEWIESEILVSEMDKWRKKYIESQKDAHSIDLQSFNFKNSHDHEIRAIIKEDGSIWFVAKDVCDILELTNPTEALKCLDPDEKDTLRISEGIPGNPNKSIISESGLYMMIFRSRKPEAKKFRKWVTSEVLPQIRKIGAYMPNQPAAYDQVQEIPQVDPAPGSSHALDEDPVCARPATITPKAITAFLKTATDTFWQIETAISEAESMRLNLRKAKKDTARVIRSIKTAFPEVAESVDMLGGQANDMVPKLEIEM